MKDDLLAALQFLTVVPVRQQFDPAIVGRSQRAFPLVGVLLGLGLWGLAVSLPAAAPVVAILILLLWILVTGGLHLDGLADSADAWAAGRGDPARALDVMRDPRCGPMAVSTLVIVLLGKWVAIVALLEADAAFALIAAPTLARSGVLLLFASTPYARDSGLGSPYLQHYDATAGLIAALLGVGLGLLLAGFWATVIALIVLAALRHLMLKAVGGMTGDTLGASIELVELAVLLGAALLL